MYASSPRRSRRPTGLIAAVVVAWLLVLVLLILLLLERNKNNTASTTSTSTTLAASPSSTSTTLATTTTTRPLEYVIQRGDTLNSIAIKFGVTRQALMELNGITNPDKILAGESLKIPPGVAPTTTLPTGTTGPPTATTGAGATTSTTKG